MEGSQRVCTSSFEGVHEFPLEQVKIHTSDMTISTIVDSEVEVG